MVEELREGLEIEERRKGSELSDAMQDLEFVKDLNRVMSIRYAEVFACFPTVQELDLILLALQENKVSVEGKDLEDVDHRIILLKKFRSALVAIEANDPQIKPKRYEDLEK